MANIDSLFHGFSVALTVHHIALMMVGVLLGRWFSRLERDLYRKIPMPDLLFILELSPELSLRRKPDHDPEAIQEKHWVLRQTIARMKAQANVGYIIHIDASFPLEDVLWQIKEVLWERL